MGNQGIAEIRSLLFVKYFTKIIIVSFISGRRMTCKSPELLYWAWS